MMQNVGCPSRGCRRKQARDTRNSSASLCMSCPKQRRSCTSQLLLVVVPQDCEVLARRTAKLWSKEKGISASVCFWQRNHLPWSNSEAAKIKSSKETMHGVSFTVTWREIVERKLNTWKTSTRVDSLATDDKSKGKPSTGKGKSKNKTERKGKKQAQ